MAQITKKALVDEITEWLTRLNRTDDSRIDPDFMNFIVDKCRADLIVQRYLKTESIEPTWLSDLGIIPFTPVNFADEASITYCGTCISKATIPQTISLVHGNGNFDFGLYGVMSTCGKTKFFSKPMTTWSLIDSEHTYANYNYFSRINSAMYVNKKVDSLRVIAILVNPEDGVLKQSDKIASGAIVAGTVYIVKNGTVIYNGVAYAANSTFTGVIGVTIYSTTSGSVYLNSQARAYRRTDPYPITPDMARQLVLDVLTKEFQIEKSQLTDLENDSQDQSKAS